ncbi:unnamed protein product [[Candida] boidinii]|uniref:Unnamed protein product n=1 Tax=Candida boidinii TaxID=5477 RepID=A0A9W6T7F3_CANBO|nr:unnamed protein product [[Candida] boidinii]GMF63586.1 unnamed protein product [[Candida] boidinii]
MNTIKNAASGISSAAAASKNGQSANTQNNTSDSTPTNPASHVKVNDDEFLLEVDFSSPTKDDDPFSSLFD